MQSKLWGVWILFACITAVFMPVAAYADIVYPSRLELIETEPGTLEVTFVLPVIQGKVLKARPVLPNSFIQIGEATTDGDYNTKTVKWRSSYVRDSLPGSRISVEGLSGSQVDLLLTIELLSGSKYRSTLSPVHAFYVIPEPMSPLEMISDALIRGMRRTGVSAARLVRAQ
jgi:hypothetical protein